jgi:hypothetical protein
MSLQLPMDRFVAQKSVKLQWDLTTTCFVGRSFSNLVIQQLDILLAIINILWLLVNLLFFLWYLVHLYIYPIILLQQVMISGAPIHLVILMAHFGSKDVIWCTVLTIACGWATSFALTGTCSSLLILVLSSTLLPGQFLVAQFMSVTPLGSTTSPCSGG